MVSFFFKKISVKKAANHDNCHVSNKNNDKKNYICRDYNIENRE